MATTDSGILVELPQGSIGFRRALRQNVAKRLPITFKDRKTKQAKDITGWVIKARMEFYTADVPESGGVATDKVKTHQKADLNLAVTIPAQAGDDVGVFHIDIPADAWDEPIPIDAKTDVPVGMIFIRVRDAAVNPTLDEPMIGQITFRHFPHLV